MKIDALCILAIYLLGYFQSKYTSYFVNTMLGKMVMIFIIIQATLYKPYLGLLFLILYISLSQHLITKR